MESQHADDLEVGDKKGNKISGFFEEALNGGYTNEVALFIAAGLINLLSICREETN